MSKHPNCANVCWYFKRGRGQCEEVCRLMPEKMSTEPSMALPKEILRMLESVNPSRSNQQLEVEHAIYDFSPDCDEAAELLDALTASLERRYRELDTSELGHYAKFLRDAIDRLADQIPSDDAEDRAYADWRANK